MTQSFNAEEDLRFSDAMSFSNYLLFNIIATVTLQMILTLGTFNVLGLSKVEKQNWLDEDFNRYNLDVLALQETKVIDAKEVELPSKHKLIFMKQKDLINGVGHGGLGFVVHKKLCPYIVQWSYVSDRVAFLDLKIPLKGGTYFLTRCINVYSPTNTKARKDNKLSTKFYKELQSASKVPSRWELYHLGDFNGKIGKLDEVDRDYGFGNHVGNYSMGTRNYNGECLLNFVCMNDMYVTNTCFQHPSRHRTTHTAAITYKSGKKVYSQIDYILCKRRSKGHLRNARSYGGTKVRSDHKLVVCKVDTSKRFLTYVNSTSKKTNYNCHRLASCKDTQKLYSAELATLLANTSVDDDPNTVMANVFANIHKSAEKTVGSRPVNRKCHYTNDPVVVELAEEKQKLRVDMESHNRISDANKDLRKRVNKIGRDIKKRLKQLECDNADRLADEITSTDDSRVMFEAVRTLCKVRETKPIIVHNNQGNPVGTDKAKATIIREWYNKKFNGEDPPLTPFVGPPRPLSQPVTCYEVTLAAKALKNGKAVGPDNTPNELLKYAGEPLYKIYASSINKCFEENKTLDAVGQCYITPLKKPGKAPGDEKSLRPLTLCNGARKLLSLITLRRIEGKVDAYTGSWQCAYKRNRSCGDLVWCQRILTSIVMEKKWSFHKLGLDMSSAFDTIRRQTILDLLIDAGCNDDEVRIVRFLLSNIKIKVKVNKELSIEFESSIGGPQGDSLSGKLFTLSLAGALYNLRAVTSRPTPPIKCDGMPEESEYSDDVDFMDTDEATLTALFTTAKDIFSEWNLQINEAKTEYVHFRIADRDELMEDGKTPLRGNEEWCTTKLLGSLMCSVKDVGNRCMLGNIAFQSFKKVWMNSRITLEKKIKVYEAQVVSIIMYNSSCWAAPAAVLEKLDICHRKHLRTIMNIRWPRSMITNDTLYKRCNTTPLSQRAALSRWKMLGHVLRSPENSPAQSALCFAVDAMNSLPGRVGRHRVNLLQVLKKDLKLHNLKLSKYEDIVKLRELAWNRSIWRNMHPPVL